jgi:hypothetical protein
MEYRLHPMVLIQYYSGTGRDAMKFCRIYQLAQMPEHSVQHCWMKPSRRRLNIKFHNRFVNLRCKSNPVPVLEKLLNFETTCSFRHFSHFMNLCISAVPTGWNVCCAVKRDICWSIYLAAHVWNEIQELNIARPIPRPSVNVANYIVQLATLTPSLYYTIFCNFREVSA